MAANPGGGGDSQSKTSGDAALEKAILALRDCEPTLAPLLLDAMATAYIEQVKNINLRKIIYPVLKAAKQDIAGIAFLNVFPYRTRDNAPPPAGLVRLAATEIGKPLVEALAPSCIFFLGSGMGKIAAEVMHAEKIYILKRARGDTHVPPDTQRQLDNLS